MGRQKDKKLKENYYDSQQTTEEYANEPSTEVTGWKWLLKKLGF